MVAARTARTAPLNLTAFGAPRDITVSELAVELFFPLDEATAEAFAQAARKDEAEGMAGPESVRPRGAGG